MSTYELTSPDGQKYRVSAPDGATEEQVWAFFESELSQHQADQHNMATRAAYGAFEPITGVAQLAYNALPESVQNAGDQVDAWLHKNTGGLLGKAKPFNEAVTAQEEWYQSGAPEGVDLARLGGNIATGLLATRGMGAPATVGKSVAQGAGVGGGLGAAAPVYQEGDFWGQKAEQAASGSAVGAAFGPVGHGISRLIQPKAGVSADVQAMRDAGIRPSIGGTLGGASNRFEQMAQSIPFLGDSIRGVRLAARDDFNRAALNKAVSASGQKVKSVGNEGVAEVQRISSEAYKAAKSMIPGLRLDATARQELAALKSSARNLKPAEARRFQRFMDNEFATRFRQGGTTSEGFKRLDAEIGKAQAGNQGTELGGAFKELEAILKRQAERVSPEYRAALDRADEIFKQRLIVESAANTAGGNGGVFTPKQLLQAIKTTDKTARKGANAGGRRPMQEFAQQASRVIGDSYPESGTAGRMMTGGVLGGGVVADPMTTALLSGALWGGGKLLYNPSAQGLLRNMATLRPQQAQAIAKEISKAAPVFAPSLLNAL